MQDREREDRIRERAHQIWQGEGMKEGEHERHWTQASNEIDAESSGSSETQTETGGSPERGTGHQPGGASPGDGPAAGVDSMGSLDEGVEGILKKK